MAEHASGNVFVREMEFADSKAPRVDGHGHNFPHVTYVTRGRLLGEKLKTVTPGEIEMSPGADYDFDPNTGKLVVRSGTVVRYKEPTFEVFQSRIVSAKERSNWLRIDANVLHRFTPLPPDESFMAEKLADLLTTTKTNSRAELVALLRAELERDERSMGHCIYAHRTPQGEVVQEYTGWPDAYR